MSPRGNPAWVATPPEDRFWPRVDKAGPVPEYRPDLGPCWIWRGTRTPKGYGMFFSGERVMSAYRWAYEATHGPVPESLELDHLCRVHPCVNPDHLEAVTHQVNMLRGETVAAAHAVKTHCPQGHPYAGDNVRLEAYGSRRCLTCKRDQMRRARAQGRAAS